MKGKILLTGSSGFVGQALLQKWDKPNQIVSCSIRKPEDIRKIDWSGIDTIIHLAGLAHQIPPAPSEDYIRSNEVLTAEIAKKGKKIGISTFIFLSTIKVYDDKLNFIDHLTLENPNDAYGHSKLKAENTLMKLADDSLNVCIVRPPLIVGAGAKGNLMKMMNLMNQLFPVPLGRISNKRSMVSTHLLVKLIKCLCKNPQTGRYLISNQPISTSDLVLKIREGMGRRHPSIFFFPGFATVVRFFRPAIYSRLFKSLQINDQETREKFKLGNADILDDAIFEMTHHFQKKL